MGSMRLLPVLLLRLALLVAIAASAALVVEYANAGDPAFCGVTSGCFAVRISPYSHLFGIPLPQIGLAAYASLFGIAFVAKKPERHLLVAVLSGIGALFAIWLLYLQKVTIGAFCAWCVAVDTSAIVAAISAAWVFRRATKDPESVRLPAERHVTIAWIGAALLAIMTPFVWGHFPAQPPLPAQVQQVQERDKLTIVSFTDFECPFCRKLHPVMHQLEARYPGKVKLVRKMMPLESHLGADPAARAFLCTPEAHREAVADKLYAATPEQLTAQGAAALAVSVGADADTVKVCMKSPETKAKIDADKKLFEELGGRGLPFTFVGKRVVLGFNPARIESAAASELAGEHISLPVPAMFALLGVAFAAAIVITLGARTREARA
jgi:uncharacterized membrane protein/predicted DsbA family dithiol-disulfide isomerase